MSRLDRDPRFRKSPINRRQRYRDVMRKDKWNRAVPYELASLMQVWGQLVPLTSSIRRFLP